jgi:hypothetical protein
MDQLYSHRTATCTIQASSKAMTAEPAPGHGDWAENVLLDEST